MAHSGGEGAREINIAAHKELIEDMRHIINCYIDCQLETFEKIEDAALGTDEERIQPGKVAYQGIEVLDYLTFGEKFKALRKQKNFTQAQFAKMFGVSRPYISRLENGKENPSEMLLLLIIEKTGVSETWIRNGGQR